MLTSVTPISARKTGEFARQLEQLGIGDDEFQLMFVEKAGYLCEVIGRLESREHNLFELEVDYDVVPEELIARKDYLRTEFGLNKPSDFKVPVQTGRKMISVATIHFGHEIGVDELSERLKRMGYRPATLIEYLTFADAHMIELDTHPVCTLLVGNYGISIRHLAPDPLAHNRRHLVCEMGYKEHGWSGIVWFLAVKEEVEQSKTV